MNRIWWIAISIIIAIILSVMTLGCIKKPAVEVSDIALRDVSLAGTTVDVGLVINNTNPIDITLDKITYEVFLVNGEQVFLVNGEKDEKIHIRANGQITVTMPTKISNTSIISALYHGISGKERPKLKVVGSVSLNLKLFSINVPFEETKEI